MSSIYIFLYIWTMASPKNVVEGLKTTPEFRTKKLGKNCQTEKLLR
jgi:hypothetical protein